MGQAATSESNRRIGARNRLPILHAGPPKAHGAMVVGRHTISAVVFPLVGPSVWPRGITASPDREERVTPQKEKGWRFVRMRETEAWYEWPTIRTEQVMRNSW